MNLVTLLDRQAAERPYDAAIVESSLGVDRHIGFRDLAHASSSLAEQLAEQGVGAGDVVVVFVPMGISLYSLLSAIWRVGAVALFLDPSASREHIARCCELLPPSTFVGTPRSQMLRATLPSLRGLRALVVDGWFPGATRIDTRADRSAAGREPAGGADASADAASDHAARLLAHEPHAVDDDTPALVTFTSGSTGLPKAAVRTHGFLYAQYRVLERTLGLAPGQIDLATLPIFALANLAAGVTTVVPDADLRRPGRINGGPVVRQCARLGVTRAAASPAFLERLVEHCEFAHDVLSFTRIHTGGAPVFPALLDRLRAIAPVARITAVYGSTEAEPIAEIDLAAVTPDDRQRMQGGAGLLAGAPVPEIRAAILSAAWGEQVGPFTAQQFAAACAPAGAAGGIVVSGEHVLSGYLGGAGDEETKFGVDGVRWHRTGDAGYFDDAGRLWLLGREVGCVRDTRGELWPFAVECAVAGFPGVARSALAAWDERRVLVVQPAARGSVDVAALRERLAWARLDEVLLTRAIPLDVRHNAKVDYPALRALVEGELG